MRLCNASSKPTTNMSPTTEQHDVDVSRSTGALEDEPDAHRIGICLRAALEHLHTGASGVSVKVVTEAEMAELNNKYRHRPRPTNVLAFQAGIDGDEGRLFLGDIVICNQVVLEESRVHGKSFPDHFSHLLVHGLLHLLGYDHQEESQRMEMENLEVTILRQQGIDHPYETEAMP